MIRVKKQYKQSDGTLIEVEGTEDEIERFEKKQRKQKSSNEQAEKKKTILYGKEFEEIRKIIREEIAAAPARIEYRYFPYSPWNWYNQPIQPLFPLPQVTWTIGQSAASVNTPWTLSTTDTVSSGEPKLWFTAKNFDGPTSIYQSNSFINNDVCEEPSWNGCELRSGNSSNFLMSPVGAGG
jgi:hypothetical protein